MRAADPPVHYLVGTPKGRLTRLEKHLIELYVLAHSRFSWRRRIARSLATRSRLWAKT